MADVDVSWMVACALAKGINLGKGAVEGSFWGGHFVMKDMIMSKRILFLCGRGGLTIYKYRQTSLFCVISLPRAVKIMRFFAFAKSLFDNDDDENDDDDQHAECREYA